MCYIIGISSPILSDEKIMIRVLKNPEVNFKDLDVWITPEYDYMGVSAEVFGEYTPLKIKVPFGKEQIPKIKGQECVKKPLKCKKSDPDYVSAQQCLVDRFISDDFSPCSSKCIPIQMKGFKYLNNSTKLVDCTNLDDEICNGGPRVWTKVPDVTFECTKPCEIIRYTSSIISYSYHSLTENEAIFMYESGPIKTVAKELLVYDTNDMIGSIGGSLGLFLGFSFFGIISKFIDRLLVWETKSQQNCVKARKFLDQSFEFHFM